MTENRTRPEFFTGLSTTPHVGVDKCRGAETGQPGKRTGINR